MFPAKSPALRRSLARRDICPQCGGALDTGWECNDCGYDAQDEAYPQNMREIDRKYDKPPVLTEIEIAAMCGGKKAKRRLRKS